MRLRINPQKTGFHVVLVNPEIPQNTGNIARLCAATGSVLHLVGKLGFSTDDKAVRRAGLDYWSLVRVEEHETLDGCLSSIGGPEPLIFTTRASTPFFLAPFEEGVPLVFGSESVGLPVEAREKFSHRAFGIPTLAGSVRSLNLANAAAIVVYKGLEAVGAMNETFLGEK